MFIYSRVRIPASVIGCDSYDLGPSPMRFETFTRCEVLKCQLAMSASIFFPPRECRYRECIYIILLLKKRFND